MVDEFINLYNESAAASRYCPALENFLNKYGLLERSSYQKIFFASNNEPVLVASVKEYSEVISELDFLKKAINNFSYKASTGDEDALWLLDEYLKDINGYLRDVHILISRDNNFNLHKKIFYPSLKHLLYSKLSDDIIEGKTPLLCKECSAIISYKKGKSYCPRCASKVRKKRYLQNLKEPQKEKIYSGVYNHLYYKYKAHKKNSQTWCEISGELGRIRSNYSGEAFYSELLEYCENAFDTETFEKIKKIINDKKGSLE